MMTFLVTMVVAAVVCHQVAAMLERRGVLGITREQLCLLYYMAVVFWLFAEAHQHADTRPLPVLPFVAVLVAMIVHGHYVSRRLDSMENDVAREKR